MDSGVVLSSHDRNGESYRKQNENVKGYFSSGEIGWEAV